MARKTGYEGGYDGLPLSMTEPARPSPSLGRKVKENRIILGSTKAHFCFIMY